MSAAMLALVGVPIAYAINRIAQREKAEQEISLASPHGGATVHGSADPQFTLKEVLRLPAFWFLSVAMALRHMVTEGVSVHFVILLVDRGWSTEAGSTLLGVSAFIGVPSRLAAGWLGDLVDKRKLIMLLLLALAIPLTLAIVFAVMDIANIDLQRISLGALIIALTLLVDDAMTTVDAMIRRLAAGDTKEGAATFAYRTLAAPMLTGTLVTIAGFVPIGFAASVR